LPAGLESADLNTELSLLRVLCSENVLLTTSNMIFTKNLFQKLGGFRDLRYCHDWDFALRACIIGRPGFSHLPLTRYRIHPANTIQEPTPHVDGEVIRLFSRLLEAHPWIEEDRLAIAALKGNRHLGKFPGDEDIGRRSGPTRGHRAPSARPRCLVLVDHVGQSGGGDSEAKPNAETLKDVCDVEIVDAGLPEQSELGFIATLARLRESLAPDFVYVCGGFGWLLGNARAIRRIFGSVPIIDAHSVCDMRAWRAYYHSPAIHSFDRFIAESEAAAGLLAGCGIPRHRIDVIHPALKPALPALADRPDLTSHTYECPLTDDGHAHKVLDLARRCRDRGWPDRFLLSFTGDPPDDALRYASAARLDNVALTGPDNAGIANAAIVLSPAAGFPAVLAALSGGRPVLAAANPEVSRLLKDFGSGMTVAEGAGPDQVWRSFAGFREAIGSLAKRAAAGGEKLRARFSRSRRAQALAKAADRALRQTGAGVE
jgi:glycosyltransferase involved in cell wall biosynthesis